MLDIPQGTGKGRLIVTFMMVSSCWRYDASDVKISWMALARKRRSFSSCFKRYASRLTSSRAFNTAKWKQLLHKEKQTRTFLSGWLGFKRLPFILVLVVRIFLSLMRERNSALSRPWLGGVWHAVAVVFMLVSAGKENDKQWQTSIHNDSNRETTLGTALKMLNVFRHKSIIRISTLCFNGNMYFTYSEGNNKHTVCTLPHKFLIVCDNKNGFFSHRLKFWTQEQLPTYARKKSPCQIQPDEIFVLTCKSYQ